MTTAPIIAWHGRQDLRDDAVARMRHHAALDMFEQGNYVRRALSSQPEGAAYRGCFHGCLTAEAIADELRVGVLDLDETTPWHRETERLYGIPQRVGRMLDWAFETVTEGDAPTFAVRATEAIPVGADLTDVPLRVLLDVLTDEVWGVALAVATHDRLGALVAETATMVRNHLAGLDISHVEAGRLRAEIRRVGQGSDSNRAANEVAWSCADTIDALIHGDYASIHGALMQASDAWADRSRLHFAWVVERILHHLAHAPAGVAR